MTPKVEWEFVLHSAKLYDRMGCDLLGLDLGMFFLWQLEPHTVHHIADKYNSAQLGVPAAHNERPGRRKQPAEALTTSKLAGGGRYAEFESAERYA